MELNVVQLYVEANGLDCRAEGSDGAADEEHGNRSWAGDGGGAWRGQRKTEEAGTAPRTPDDLRKDKDGPGRRSNWRPD